jgi:hypothetical protein
MKPDVRCTGVTAHALLAGPMNPYRHCHLSSPHQQNIIQQNIIPLNSVRSVQACENRLIPRQDSFT